MRIWSEQKILYGLWTKDLGPQNSNIDVVMMTLMIELETWTELGKLFTLFAQIKQSFKCLYKPANLIWIFFSLIYVFRCIEPG